MDYLLLFVILFEGFVIAALYGGNSATVKSWRGVVTKWEELCSENRKRAQEAESQNSKYEMQIWFLTQNVEVLEKRNETLRTHLIKSCLKSEGVLNDSDTEKTNNQKAENADRPAA